MLPLRAANHGLLMRFGQADGIALPFPRLIVGGGVQQMQEFRRLRHPFRQFDAGNFRADVQIEKIGAMNAVTRENLGLALKHGRTFAVAQNGGIQRGIRHARNRFARQFRAGRFMRAFVAIRRIFRAKREAQRVHDIRAGRLADIPGHRNVCAFQPLKAR